MFHFVPTITLGDIGVVITEKGDTREFTLAWRISKHHQIDDILIICLHLSHVNPNKK